jgi:hypothetical protein
MPAQVILRAYMVDNMKTKEVVRMQPNSMTTVRWQRDGLCQLTLTEPETDYQQICN